jgi:hypothetical protein
MATYTTGSGSFQQAVSQPQPTSLVLQLNSASSQSSYQSQLGQKLRVDQYTDKSIIVRGDTRPYVTKMKLMKGTWISKPREGGEQGWCFGNFQRQEVEQYVAEVNSGTAAPPPTYEVQTVSWTLFKPIPEMKLKITMPQGAADYTVSSVENEGWTVVGATIFAPHNPSSVHRIVIVNGKWQIFGYLEEHSVQPH